MLQVISDISLTVKKVMLLLRSRSWSRSRLKSGRLRNSAPDAVVRIQTLMLSHLLIPSCVVVYSDGRDRGRGGGDQAGDQRAEEVLPPQEHCHLLRGLHQEVPTGKGTVVTITSYYRFVRLFSEREQRFQHV